MIFSWDDFCDDQDSRDALGLLYQLKQSNRKFKATLFAIPGKCSATTLASLPDWLEVAPHGWLHPDPHECETWTYEETFSVMTEPAVVEFMAQGWKSPGWLVSDGTYEALVRNGWWICDHPKNNDRRPEGLRSLVLGAEGYVHGHVGSKGVDNGIQDVFGVVEELVRQAGSFEFVSEAVKPWTPSKSRA